MGYTTAEKRAALSALTQQSLTFSRNAFGGRNTSATYTQLRELVLTGLYFEPDAVFALIDLSADYWAGRVASMRSQVASLREDVAFLLAKDRTFQRLDLLRRAKATIGRARVTAAVQNKVGVKPLERYRRLVDQALADMSRQTVQAGAALSGASRQVVKAKKAVQRTLSSDFYALASAHATLRGGLDNLAEAFDAYEGAGALAELSLVQLERLDDLTGDIVDELETLSEAAAREKMRGYFLDLLGGQAVARRLQERKSAAEPRLQVTTDYRMTASTPVTPPSVTGVVSAPWPLEQGASDILQVSVSGTTRSVDLLPASQNEVGIEAASLTGLAFEPFRIVSADTNPYPLLTKKITSGANYTVNGTKLYLVVDGDTHEVAFGSDQNATQVASTIGSAVSTVTAAAQSGGGQDWVQISYNNSSPPDRYDYRSMVVVSGLNNAADLSPFSVDGPSGEVPSTYRTFGADQRDTLKLFANDDATSTTITLTAGAWPDYERTAAQVAADITTAGGTSFEAADSGDGRVVISSELKGEGSLIRMTSDGLSGGAETVSHRTLTELGFVQYLESRKSDISIGQLLNTIGLDTTFTGDVAASSTRQVLYEARNAEVTGTNTLRFDVGTTDPSTSWTLGHTKAAIHTGGNQGTYVIDSVSYASPYLTLTLDRDLRDQTAGNRFSVSVLSELLTLTSLDTTVGSYLQVQSPALSADTQLGLPTTLVKGTTTTVLIERADPVSGWAAVDLRPYTIRVGDLIYDASGVLVATVTGVSQLGAGLLSVTAVNADFSLTTGFTIRSAAYSMYKSFALDLAAFRRGFRAYEDDELKVIADRLLPQLRQENPSRDQVVAVGSLLDSYDAKLEALETLLVGYSVTQPAVVTRTLRALQEHGHDRARQLLLEGDLGAFFTLTSDGASRSQHLMGQMSGVAISDVNEPTFHDNDDEAELDRFMVGYEEDDNPAFELEDEEEWPDSPLEARPLNPSSSTVSTDYMPTSRGGKR
jgi:hypothetical protein